MFREKIREKYETLTPSFCKLADFVLQNELDAAFMTATEMAERLDVDAATVVRFAQELGFAGFRDLSEEIQETVRSELKADYRADLDASDDLGLFRGLVGNEQHNLSLAQDQMTKEINTILPSLLNADQIWVMGQGHGVHLAALCASVLREIGLPAVSIAPNPLEVATNLKEVGKGDLVIGFSISGMNLDTANAVKFARQRGAATIVFSASHVAAAALAAETAVICPGPTQTDVPSFTGLTAMIVVVASAFAARYPEEAEEMKEDVRQSYREMLDLQVESASELDIEELWREF